MPDFKKVSDNNFDCLPLQWDTDFFGIRSARVNLNGVIDEEGQGQILDFCEKYNFVTIFNKGNIAENNIWIGLKTKAFLTDMNIQFVKDISNVFCKQDPDSVVRNYLPKDERITDLAKRAFLYSRFFNDPNLPASEAKSIYFHWTECAFNKQNKYFVICKRNDIIAGYILFSFDEIDKHLSTIELIAVDERFRGQGVGKSLVCTMEHFIEDKNVNKIKVGTQIVNKTAVQFYMSSGFKYAGCGAMYHLWNLNKREVII